MPGLEFCPHIVFFAETLRKLAAVYKSDFKCGSRAIYKNSSNVYPGIKLEFRDKISNFPLLSVTSIQNNTVEIFHTLIT